jgi:hypothetical protein
MRAKADNRSMSAAGTSRNRLLSLAACGDPASLRSAVSELCAEFGKVTRLEVFTLAEAEKRRAFCLLRLESPAQEDELMMMLGAAPFGDDLLLVVDLANSQAEALC